MDSQYYDFSCYYVSADLRERVFYCAREGMPLHLCALLFEKNDFEISDLLNTNKDFLGVKCTPLIVASRYGQDNAVRMMLEKFMPPVDLEIEGTVKFDEYVIEGATALWCAAGAGHLDVVKQLVRAGANVNHATRTQSTPLRAACFDGRLDIVKYLARHGADLHKANKYNNTCLMISSYKGHLDVVQFLLEGGADVNAKALCGATALHFASECGHIEVVLTLIEHGAKIMANDNGLSPLQSAAERARAQVVEILASRPEVKRIEAIEAYELLGASFANDKEFYCARKSYKYLHQAMLMRYDTSKGILPKKLIPPVPAYDNWKESSTLEELENINGDAHCLHMEGLTVRERILGRKCPDVPHPVVFRGAVFADEANFDRCLALWRHALVLRQDNHVALMKDLLRFAQVFSQMIHIGIDLPLEEVIFVMEACSEELVRGADRMSRANDHVDTQTAFEEYESNVRTALYLVSEAARLLEINEYNEELKCKVGKAIFSLKDVRLNSGQTLLHLAVDRQTPVDDFHTSDVCQFPCVQTARLLMQCGVDVDIMDKRRRTALHIVLISFQESYTEDRESWSEALKSVVIELLHRGAHHDVMDEDRLTPLAAAKGSPVELLMKTVNPRLSCLAAGTLARHQYRYRPSQVPGVLHRFLDEHGVRTLD